MNFMHIYCIFAKSIIFKNAKNAIHQNIFFNHHNADK